MRYSRYDDMALTSATLTIGTCAAIPGRLTRGLLPAGVTSARKAVFLPLLIAQGFFPGPTVLLTAAMHGDEVAGVEIIRRVLAGLPLAALRGTILAVPVANPPAFRRGQRTVPDDDADLNRSFPGDREGTLAAQIAWHLFTDVLRHADLAIDLHDAGRQNLLLPHVRIPTGCTDRLLDFALALGTELLIERDGAGGMFAIEAQRQHHIPVLTLELGGGQHLDAAILSAGQRALGQLLAHLGMVPGETVRPATQMLMRETSGIPSPVSGLLQCPHALGTPLAAGSLLAEVVDPLSGREEQILAPQTGLLFSRKAHARIEEGEAIGSLLPFQADSRFGAMPLLGRIFDHRQSEGPLVAATLREGVARLFDPGRHRLAAE